MDGRNILNTFLALLIIASVAVIVANATGIMSSDGLLNSSSHYMRDGDQATSTISIGSSTDELSDDPKKAVPSYLEQEYERLIESGEKFVDIDLAAMRLVVHEDGEVIHEMPVKAIASKTSWWRTAPGVYEAQSKLPTHESSFGNVIMPWNIPFQGNFFIHGWPYYIDSGNPATSQVSGGCIRLAEADAKVLYQNVPVGTPIIVRDDTFDPSLEYGLLVQDFEEISAEAFLAVDLSQDKVLLASNERAQMPVGNVALLLSALTMSERIGMNTEMHATDEFATDEREDNIEAGERYRLYDLLFPLLQDWSHEPEATVANYMGVGSFQAALGYKARAVGMNNSDVTYSAGEGVTLTTTALDLVNLSEYLYIYRNFIFDISASNETIYLYGKPSTGRRAYSRIFPGYADFVGGSYDEATGSSIAMFELDVDGETRPYLFVALHSDDPLQDILRMRQHILDGESR